VHRAIQNYSHKDTESLQVAAEECRERADVELTRREALEGQLTRAKSENAELSSEIKTLREEDATQTRNIKKIRGILFGLSHMLQDRASKTYEDSQQVTRVAEYLQLGSNPCMPSHSIVPLKHIDSAFRT
jgi:predicted nuclease with TOPRIM domain